jgi:DNA-directed RNA polymerase alpha subunit
MEARERGQADPGQGADAVRRLVDVALQMAAEKGLTPAERPMTDSDKYAAVVAGQERAREEARREAERRKREEEARMEGEKRKALQAYWRGILPSSGDKDQRKLATRCVNALADREIASPEELAAMTERGFLCLGNVGGKCLGLISGVLAAHGLSFAPEVSHDPNGPLDPLMKLDDLNWEDRPRFNNHLIRGALEEAGMVRLVDFCAFTEGDVLAVKGIGPKALEEIRSLLHRAGLDFRRA